MAPVMLSSGWGRHMALHPHITAKLFVFLIISSLGVKTEALPGKIKHCHKEEFEEHLAELLPDSCAYHGLGSVSLGLTHRKQAETLQKCTVLSAPKVS